MCDFFPNWDDIALAGAMAEELAEEELERRRIEAEHEVDDEEEKIIRQSFRPFLFKLSPPRSS